MSVQTFEGIVEKGRVRLLGDPRLPENAKVFVVIPECEVSAPARIPSPRIAYPEQADDFKKIHTC